jgi:hypothetical protein
MDEFWSRVETLIPARQRVVDPTFSETGDLLNAQ